MRLSHCKTQSEYKLRSLVFCARIVICPFVRFHLAILL